MEKINVFVIAIPTFDSVVEKIKDAIEDAFEEPKKFVAKQNGCGRKFEAPKRCDEDLTPPKFRINKPCNGVEPWGVFGEPADENKRFGYGLEVDEPRYQDFDDDEDFLEAREAFDDFVDSGERCRELGLEKTNDAPITKCNAIRKPIGCPPPMGVNLLGESQFPWWECID